MGAIRPLVVAAGLLAGACTSPSLVSCATAEVAQGCAVTTELFLGLSRPDGTVLSDREWQGFLSDIVTPLFPDGFTVLVGDGQWRQPGTADISHEPSKVLMIVHNKPGDDDRITALIAAYKNSFLQESVLRVDLKSIVSF